MPNLSLQHRLELITAPTAEPITVSDAKKQMRIEHSDDDSLIARLINTAIALRQPKLVIMNHKSQSQVELTIRTGGAAYGVSVPPIEILTKSTPIVAYLNLSLISLPK